MQSRYNTPAIFFWTEKVGGGAFPMLFPSGWKVGGRVPFPPPIDAHVVSWPPTRPYL